MSEPFDFEAFIAGAQLARRKVSFFKIDHTDELARLTAEHDALPEGGDERESSKSQRRKVAERIAALRAEMEASRTYITVRTLTPDEYDNLVKDDALDGRDQFALQTVDPQLTGDQVRALFDKIGFAQAAVMLHDATELITTKVMVPDFSQSVSTTLSPPESSQS